MPDQVIGVAILDISVSPQLLYVQCQPEGRRFISHKISVYPFPAPAPPCRKASWCYRIEGDLLHMTPSLHIRYELNGQWVTGFHNAYYWTVKFKLAVPDADEYYGYRQLREANTALQH